MRKLFSDKNINVFNEHNKIIIMYNKTSLTTKITVNNKLFDTSFLNGFSLEQITNPIEEKNWRGIFPELQEYVANIPFSVVFSGESQDMNCLIAVCPENVNLSYKASNFSAQSVSETANSLLNSAKSVVQNVNNSETFNFLVDSAKSAVQNANSSETITVGGKTITKKILAKLVILISLICFIFPFVSVSCNTMGDTKKNYSGLQLMIPVGQEDDELASESDKNFAPNIFLWLAFIAGILTLLVLMAHIFWGKLPDSITTKLNFISNNPSRFSAITSAIGAVCLLLFRISFMSYYKLSDYKDYITVKSKFAFILSFILMLACAVLCFLSKENNSPQQVNTAPDFPENK